MDVGVHPPERGEYIDGWVALWRKPKGTLFQAKRNSRPEHATDVVDESDIPRRCLESIAKPARGPKPRGVLVMDLFGRLEVQVGWGGFGPVSMGMICAGGQAGGTGGGRCRLMYGTE